MLILKVCQILKPFSGLLLVLRVITKTISAPVLEEAGACVHDLQHDDSRVARLQALDG